MAAQLRYSCTVMEAGTDPGPGPGCAMPANILLYVTTVLLQSVRLHQTVLNITCCQVRIVVLAWNRPTSLTRLLTSLQQADYTFTRNNPGWQLMLEIRLLLCWALNLKPAL